MNLAVGEVEVLEESLVGAHSRYEVIIDHNSSKVQKNGRCSKMQQLSCLAYPKKQNNSVYFARAQNSIAASASRFVQAGLQVVVLQRIAVALLHIHDGRFVNT